MAGSRSAVAVSAALVRLEPLAWPARRCGHAQMQAGERPAVPVTHEHVRHAELAVGGTALVGRLLGLPAAGDGRRAEIADLDLVPVQRSGDHLAERIPGHPLGLVQYEAERANQPEVVRRELGQGGSVGGAFRLGPPGADGEYLCAGVTGHCGLLSLCVGASGAGAVIGRPCRYICGGLFPADWPPSIGSTVPVTNDDCSEQSHSTALATSATVPVRRIGTDSPACRCASGPAAARWWVRIGPGATTLTRMPWSA